MKDCESTYKKRSESSAIFLADTPGLIVLIPRSQVFPFQILTASGEGVREKRMVTQVTIS